MREGCRKPAAECEFAHVYVEGAREAREDAAARALLPCPSDGERESGVSSASAPSSYALSGGRPSDPGEDSHHHHHHRGGQQPPPGPPRQGSSSSSQDNSPPRPDPAHNPPAEYPSGPPRLRGDGRWRHEMAPAPAYPGAPAPGPPPAYYGEGGGGGGGGSGGHPMAATPGAGAYHGVALLPAVAYDGYSHPNNPPPPPSSYVGAAYPMGGQGAAGDEGGLGLLYPPSKTYVHMPRTNTGQRICYYHNVGKCTNAVCPFVHVLVRWALPFCCLLLGGGVIVS